MCPDTGTFTTADPLDGVDGTPTVANPYHYTDNDPLNRIDPLGLRPTDANVAAAACAIHVRTTQTQTPPRSTITAGGCLAATALVLRGGTLTIGSSVPYAPDGSSGDERDCGILQAILNPDCDELILYRAVEPAELGQIVRDGYQYRVADGMSDGKHFFPTAAQASNFARVNPGREYTLTSAEFPGSTFLDPEIWVGSIGGEGEAIFISGRYFPHGPVQVHGALP